MLSQARLARLRSQLDASARQADAYVRAYMAAFRSEYPEAGVAEVRELAKSAIADALSVFGDQAAEVAGQLFDELAAEAGEDATAAIFDTIDPSEVDRKVRWLARRLADGDYPGFEGSVRDLTRYYVRRQAFENMARNCEVRRVRYARVPSGTETCAFCFMLCSRGFVYKSERTAGVGHQYHDHCDCVIVPGFGGGDQDHQVEGYEPSGMYERWKACARTADVDADEALGNPELRRRVLEEVETRDWRWLYSGEEPEVSYEGWSARDKRKLAEQEKWEHAFLAKNGFPIFPIPTDRAAPANIDLWMSGELWELKSVTGDVRRVGQRIDEAVSKWDRLHEAGLSIDSVPKVIVDNTRGRSSDDDVAAEMRKKMIKYAEKGFDEAYLIRRDNTILHIRSEAQARE